MIKAKRNRFSLWFYPGYFRIMEKIFFREVEYRMEQEIPDGPVLLLQNHFSWWDGYWSFVIAEKILKRNFHVMMLEKELKRRKFLSQTGAFSVDPEGKNMLASIRYAVDLLKHPRNVVTIYPQGKLVSHYTRTVAFEPGTDAILRLAGGNVNVVFASAHIEFGSTARPKATIFISCRAGENDPSTSLKEAYNRFYTDCRNSIIEANQ
jgi:1-acyl-sn-glycerol-3-phosphate acyltransferase